jgi:hypothetical protein
MSSNHHPHFWEINKASTFIDAMNASHSRPRHHERYPEYPQYSPNTPAKPATSRSRHLLVTFISLAVVGGLVAANWIA